VGMRISRIGFLIGVTALFACVASYAAAPAKAGLLSCGKGSQPFLAVDGDSATYYAMSNGGFESGSTSWSLSRGASVVSGNEPWVVGGGTHSLSLPSGSSAVGPKTCLALLSPMLRMFASDAGGTDSGLRVTIEYRSLLGSLLGVSSFTTFGANDYRSWRPTERVNVPLGILSGVPLLTAYFQMRLTPIGSGSKWLVDDVFVDPFVHGM
jgi:hypothetical protein